MHILSSYWSFASLAIYISIAPSVRALPNGFAASFFRSTQHTIQRLLGLEAQTCEDLILTLFLDEYPEEVAYNLTCDGETLWNRDYNHFTQENAFEIQQETALCLLPEQYCIFSIHDSYGDGLIMAGNLRVGGLVLIWGATTVGVYNGSYPYETLEFCFGVDCPLNITSFLEGNDDTDDDDQSYDTDDTLFGEEGGEAATSSPSCVEIDFRMTFDEFPNEVGYTLQCGEKAIWDVPVGTYKLSQQFQTVENSECLALSECCQFTMVDSFGDGITSPQDNMPGSFRLMRDGQQIVFYDGSDANAKVSHKSCLKLIHFIQLSHLTLSCLV